MSPAVNMHFRRRVFVGFGLGESALDPENAETERAFERYKTPDNLEDPRKLIPGHVTLTRGQPTHQAAVPEACSFEGWVFRSVAQRTARLLNSLRA